MTYVDQCMAVKILRGIMRFAILGPLEVVGPAGMLEVRGARRTALLSMLLMRAGEAVLLADLVKALWYAEPPPSAVDNIRTHVSGLRYLLRRAGDRASRLTSHPGAYRLTAETEELDLLQFTALAEHADRALHGGDYAAAAQAAGEALTLWRGRPLSGLEVGDELAAHADALEERYWATFSRWISARLALGEDESLIPVLREKVQERPLYERLWANLATALHAAGRTGDALAACAEARETFIEELGIEPGHYVAAVQSAILRGEQPAAARSPVVVQAPVTPHQLPPEPASLVGRRPVQRRLASAAETVALGTADTSVVVVCGQPGIGKSALALSTAYEVGAMFPDGQLYVDLGGASPSPREPNDALAAVLSGLGWQPSQLPGDLDARLALYRSLLAGRHMVVVLDDAASTAQVQPLLPSNGSLGLVTSRNALSDLDALEGVTLDALAEPEALALLAHYVGRERVEAEAEAAQAIVSACAGHPLAIRVVAARMRARPCHPLEVMAARLSDESGRLDELNLGALSVRARYAASYHALDAVGRRFYRSLAFLDRRRITPAIVAARLALPENRADLLLESLVARGLLIPEPDTGRQARYRMPALAHLYAREEAAAEGR